MMKKISLMLVVLFLGVVFILPVLGSAQCDNPTWDYFENRWKCDNQPLERVQGRGTSESPYRYAEGRIGVANNCQEVYYWDGEGWIKLTEGDDIWYYEKEGRKVYPVTGKGNAENPYQEIGMKKGLSCSIRDRSQPPFVVYETDTGWDITSPTPITTPGFPSATDEEEVAVAVTPRAQTFPRVSRSQLSKEIDEVWLRIADVLKLGNLLWEPQSGRWASEKELYPAESVSPLTGKNSFDSIILEAATRFNLEAALIKAVISAESSFDAWEISSTGCVGLMQVCAGSAKPEFIRQVSGHSVNLEKSCCEEADCLPYYRRCGGSNLWCSQGGYRCSPQNDDRFEPWKNVMSGTATLKAKTSAAEQYCGTECSIAAYNIGECVIKKAAESVEQLPLSWGDVHSAITPEIMDSCSDFYKSKDAAWKNKKKTNLKPYVARIMREYESYKNSLIA